MSKRKYEHLVKKLNVRKGPGGVLPKEVIWLNSQNLEGIQINFGGGTHTTIGAAEKPQVHKYDEVLFLLGLDSNDLAYLGAEVAMELGEEQEEHIVNESVITVVPKGLPHGPSAILRMDKPFRTLHLLLAPDWQIDWIPEERKRPKTKGDKYTHLIKPLRGRIISPVKKGVGPGNADQLVWFHGKDLEGLELNFTWGVYSGCGTWHREEGKSMAHTHPYDEIIILLGMDPDNLSYLGAEIEMDMGSEHERYIVNESSVVICPKELPHGPVTTRWVDKPFGCFVISLSSEYKANWVEY
ncbi:MAG: hypothetical protein QW717_02865 [Candidatus Bathyarchaeia archaeon]